MYGEKKGPVPRIRNNKDSVHWDSSFAIGSYMKTDCDHCEGWPHEACDNYNKYVIMIDEYGNIQMAAGGA